MCADIEWAEIVVSVKKCYADAVANFLIEQGSTGIVEEYPKTSADIVVLKAYLLQHDEHAAAVAGSLKNYMISLHTLDGTEQLNAEISVNSIPDEDWNKKEPHICLLSCQRENGLDKNTCKQCDRIWQNFATLAKSLKSWAIYAGLI